MKRIVMILSIFALTATVLVSSQAFASSHGDQDGGKKEDAAHKNGDAAKPQQDDASEKDAAAKDDTRKKAPADKAAAKDDTKKEAEPNKAAAKEDAKKATKDEKSQAATKKDADNLTEGEIEDDAYKKRADLVKDLKNRVKVVHEGLDKISKEVQDDELKKALVGEMQELADKADEAVDHLAKASGKQWDELEKKVDDILKELDAFVQKLQEKVS